MSPHSSTICIDVLLDEQMSTKTDDDFYQSDDDLDEDEATQYIIEQSLIQYRKLKGLNPRLKSFKLALAYLYIVSLLVHFVNFTPLSLLFTSDLKSCEDPDEIFKAITEGKPPFFLISQNSFRQ